ncbi:hypothetical protein ACOME3_004605 [Neoechinorhynchus agilis]
MKRFRNIRSCNEDDLTTDVHSAFVKKSRKAHLSNSSLGVIEPDIQPNCVRCFQRKRKGHRLRAEEAIRLVEIGELELKMSMASSRPLSLSQIYTRLLTSYSAFIGSIVYSNALRSGLHLRSVDSPNEDVYDWTCLGNLKAPIPLKRNYL